MSVKRLIFLDFDGVLNSDDYLVDISDWLSFDALDESKIQLVNQIIEATDAKIVISSSWRNTYPLEEIENELIKRGFKGEIIGSTPSLAAKRGVEIQAWLDGFSKEIESFVILDDCSDMEPLNEHLIQIDPNTGLVEGDVKFIIYSLIG